MTQAVYRHRDVKLTGIKKLKGKRKGETAVILCSGTTLSEYDDSIVPESWTRFAVNEAIGKIPETADYWVLSDDPIVREYSDRVQPQTTVLAMHDATERIGRFCKTAKQIFTTTSMSKIRDYDNGHEFFSRGTVMIGAVEMARYMGFTRFFVFGCDCFRRKGQYYYDGRKPVPYSEKNFDERQRVRAGMPTRERIYVTSRLRRMIEKLDEVSASGLWDSIEIFCVNSPWSQQRAMPKITLDAFRGLAQSEADPPWKGSATPVEEADVEEPGDDGGGDGSGEAESVAPPAADEE